MCSVVGSGSRRAIDAFLRNPNEETRRMLAMYSMYGALGTATLAEIGKFGDLGESRATALRQLAALVH
jgi:hypothetical protein